ncbi:MAG: hypothetical protein HYS62_02455 [Candidatus Aenigmarchaeota archaeon]|nr:hypothetical protein [Candidatus Aenigmarchaeota archaeon]
MVTQTEEEITLSSLLQELRGELPPSVIRNPEFRRVLDLYRESASRRRMVLHRQGADTVRNRVLVKARESAQKFLDYKRGKRLGENDRNPLSQIEAYLKRSKKLRIEINEESRNNALARLEERVMNILGQNSLQKITNFHTYDFDDLRYELKKNGLTWVDGLVILFSESPPERGDKQLRIEQYGNRPLSRYMFTEYKGVWDNIVNRVLVTRALVDGVSRQKDVHDVDLLDFVSKSNPINRSLKQLLITIRHVYGTRSHYIAMIEAGIITPENWYEFKKHNPYGFRFTPDQIRELATKREELLRTSQDKVRVIQEFQRSGYSEREIGKLFGVSRGSVRRWVYDQERDARNRRNWANKILNGVGVNDELPQESIEHIKSLRWSSRKKVAYELYLRGYSFAEIAGIIGTESDPYTPISRQSVEQYVDPTEYDSRLHGKRMAERLLKKSADALCAKFGLTKDDLEKVVEPNYSHMSIRGMVELSGLPYRLIAGFLKLTDRQALSSEDADKREFIKLYEGGENIWFYALQKDEHRHNLRDRLIHRYGSFPNVLDTFGIPKEEVIRR